MRKALGTQASGLPAVEARLEDVRRHHAQVRANCARQLEEAIEMRKAAADMREWTRRRRVAAR